VTVAVAPEFMPRIRRDEPMSKHTSWHVGGPAEVYFNPQNRDELASFLRQLDASVPVYWVGLGSNLLVRDGGLDGVVISTHGTLDRLERVSETTVFAEAGVACARIAKQCIKWGLGPAEFFAGIPGTMGGALAMNAGAFGGETWNHVLEVETIDRHGRQHTRRSLEYKATYRHVESPVADEWFLASRLSFEHRPGVNEAQVRDLLAKRKATQPIGEWSGGSTFTNPPQDHAARLIEVSGLKGFRIGDASVSEKHANFIINHGNAKAADIEALITHVQATVASQHGVRLNPEVRIVGKQN
jgi:UDP-N-acetylmuramate dehydrogenase